MFYWPVPCSGVVGLKCHSRHMVQLSEQSASQNYGLRPGAEEFPLMVVISIIYPCNYGCPMCPYTDSNSELRRYYKEHDGDLISSDLWNKMAEECGTYGAWMRCTGGGDERRVVGSCPVRTALCRTRGCRTMNHRSGGGLAR